MSNKINSWPILWSADCLKGMTNNTNNIIMIVPMEQKLQYVNKYK